MDRRGGACPSVPSWSRGPAMSSLAWNKSRNTLMRRGNGLLLEGRHSAFLGAARRLSFADAASAPDGAREGRMPSLLKALPMSGSLSLLPARRRPGVLGGLQNSHGTNPATLSVLAIWARSRGPRREGVSPSHAPSGARVRGTAAQTAPCGAWEGETPSLRGPRLRTAEGGCHVPYASAIRPAGWELVWNKPRNALIRPTI